MKDSPLDAAADMEFTPSEIDELETIELLESEQPEGFWIIEEGDIPPSFPGQMIYTMARIRKRENERAKRLEKARAERYEPLAVEREESLPEEHEAFTELQEDVSGPQRETACPPPQKRRRLRQRQPRDGLLPPPLRCSARIAGMKRPAEPLPSQTAPNKRPRGRVVMKTPAPAAQSATQETQRRKTRPVPARPPPKIETETRPNRRLGRRKQNELSTRSATKKTLARTFTLAGAGRGGAETTNMPATPRRRGRPRKNE
ncbi:hypothetical protein QBC36DRAFT_391522 [Triangularia setosa]|uniref:Uncharacterized protein n=1 Tax=Triangularia setosa TaxID=2587417 RepID=A0AAN7A235_9PEZI|nr:hypothetical protein QBC36DRAFT_391522 [Podospora setosa]